MNSTQEMIKFTVKFVDNKHTILEFYNFYQLDKLHVCMYEFISLSIKNI